jgi:DNA-binding winged helix-turn-helix (wHTH) protein
VANLVAIMRRTHGHGSATISVGNLVADLSRNYAKVGKMQLELSVKGFWIIELFALRKGAVLSKDTFLNHLYDGIDEPEPKIIDVLICKLRHKLVENGADGLSVDTVGGKAISLAKRATIKCLKKQASRSPLFVEAVPVPLQFISRLDGVSAQPHSPPELVDLLKRDSPSDGAPYLRMMRLGFFASNRLASHHPIMAEKHWCF